jgi:hypothetical protein
MMALCKKIVMALFIIVPIIVTTSVIEASDYNGIVLSEPEEDNYGADIFHYLVGEQRAYIHFALPTYDSSQDYIRTYKSDSDHSIEFFGIIDGFNRVIYNPFPTLFNSLIIETKDENGNFIIDRTFDDPKYNYIKFDSSPEGLEISTFDANFPMIKEYTGEFLTAGMKYRMYWTTITSVEDVKVADLPVTNGSPFNKIGDYGNVNMTIDGNYLSIEIDYKSMSYKLSKLLIDDITTFHNIKRAYYYSDDEEKFITFTYDEQDPIFLQSVKQDAYKWIDTITWNLTTNEMRTINKIEVFAHHDIDDNRNVYTYMYIPNLIHDSIVSITAGFQYKYSYMIGKDGETQTTLVTLQSGESNTFSPTWEKKLLKTIINPMYGGFVLGSKFYGLFGIAIPDLYEKHISQIERVSQPSLMLKNDLINEWNRKYNTNVSIDENLHSLYKLNWGQFDKFGVNKVNLIDGSFSFSEIVYVFNGRVGVLDFGDIDLKDTVGSNLEENETKTFLEIFLDVANKYPVITIAVCAVILVLLMVAIAPLINVIGIIVKVLGVIINSLISIFNKPIILVPMLLIIALALLL